MQLTLVVSFVVCCFCLIFTLLGSDFLLRILGVVLLFWWIIIVAFLIYFLVGISLWCTLGFE